ncbi:MAG TPA: hypothetical protein VGC70_07720, partial [Burkholderiales bacterium]
MTLLPKTLRARTILLVFAAVLIVHAISVVGVFHDRDEFIASATAGAFASYIRLLQAAMAATPPEKQRALLATFKGPTGMHLVRDEARFTTPMDTNPLGRFAKLMRAELASDSVVLKNADTSPLAVFVGFE